MMIMLGFMAHSMRRKAYAKLTLYLHAEKRLDKLLHFRNVIVPIDLFDMVYLDVNETMHIETDKKYLPNDKRNTVYKTISLMKKKYDIKDNFKVRIIKNIPAQSGMGGGSADAACVINMMNEMYDLNMSREAMISVGREIDEDTPFCLFNEPSLVEGIGDILTPIEMDVELYYVLIKPGFGISTKSFLKRFDHFAETSDGVDETIEALKTNDVEKLYSLVHNDFQKPVSKKNTKLKRVSRQLKELGLEGVCMSGSGTSIYGLTQDITLAQSIYKKLVFDYPFVKYGKIQTNLKKEDY